MKAGHAVGLNPGELPAEVFREGGGEQDGGIQGLQQNVLAQRFRQTGRRTVPA